MSIILSSRILADCRFNGVFGRKVVGGFGIRLSISFEVKNWSERGAAPRVALGVAAVSLSTNDLIGFAVPEKIEPFRMGAHSYSTGLLLDLPLSARALEALEGLRVGTDLVLVLRLIGEITIAGTAEPVHDDILCRISQSDWLRCLEECGYGRSLLFEVPITAPGLSEARSDAPKELERARLHFLRGHYQEAVAACRRVIERLTHDLDQGAELQQAREARGADKQSLSIAQRELLIRQAVVNFAHPAHHSDRGTDDSYDRLDAMTILGVTASLVSGALQRRSTGSED